MAEQLRVAVFYDDEDQRKRAEAALGDAEVFNGVVEGTATEATLEQLVGEGLVVDAMPEHHEETPEIAEPPVAPPAPDPEVVADIKQIAQDAELPLKPDPTGERVHHIRLRGPITEEQRLELDGLGVDITAFEPPDRYRSFLTPEQLEQVRELPYVREVLPYRFEEVMTPELVETIAAASSAGPEALADTGPATQEFDCLMHRERDLPRIRELIEATEGMEVLGESNLRVRFRGPAEVPVLAALAALPEVRRLSTHEWGKR